MKDDLVGVMHLFVCVFVHNFEAKSHGVLECPKLVDIINLQSFWVKPTDVESDQMSCTYCNIFSVKKGSKQDFSMWQSLFYPWMEEVKSGMRFAKTTDKHAYILYVASHV